MKSDLAALGAVLLWASLASLGASLGHIPPLLLTGIGLLLGSLISLPLAKFKLSALKVRPKILAIGVYGLFGFHFALFAALQNAPAVQANLVNYLWPLLIVVLAPLFIKTKLLPRHVIAAVIGFSGAAIAISTAGELSAGLEIGYLYAFFAAVIWATYSLLTKKFGNFPTSAVGSFGFVSGVLALVAHFVLEDQAVIAASDWLLLIPMGFGALGGAFYLWDYALKNGSAQRVGIISFATPVISTLLLVVTQGEQPTIWLVLAAGLIVTAAWIGRERV